MGEVLSIQTTDLPDGCWNRLFDAFFQEVTDCDCRTIGYCPAGPPPPPPIWEFLNINPNEVITVPRPTHTPLRMPEDWDSIHNGAPYWEATFWADPPMPDWYKWGKRDETDMAYLGRAAGLFGKLSAEKQAFLVNEFKGSGLFGRPKPTGTTNVAKEARDESFQRQQSERMGDYKLGLSTLLADPVSFTSNIRWPREVKEHGELYPRPTSPRDPRIRVGPLLSRCAFHALEQVQKHGDYLLPAAVSGSQIASLWNITTEAQALLASDSFQKKMGNQTLWPADVEHDTLCKDVYSAASSSLTKQGSGNGSYVASFEDIMKSIELQIWGKTDLAVPELRIARANLDWSEENMKRQLGEAYADMAIGLDYLSLSMRALPGLLN